MYNMWKELIITQESLVIQDLNEMLDLDKLQYARCLGLQEEELLVKVVNHFGGEEEGIYKSDPFQIRGVECCGREKGFSESISQGKEEVGSRKESDCNQMYGINTSDV